MDQLTVGLIGCGWEGHLVHAASVLSLPRTFRLTHCADPNVLRTGALAASTGASACSVDDLVGAVDVVCVAAPPHARADLVARAVEAGPRAVVVAAPVGWTPPQVDTVAAVVASHDVPVVVHVPTSGDPAWSVAAEVVRALPPDAIARFTCARGRDLEAHLTEQLAPPWWPDLDEMWSEMAATAWWHGRHDPVVTDRIRGVLALARDIALCVPVFGHEPAVEPVLGLESGLEAAVRYGEHTVLHTHVEQAGLRHDWRFELMGRNDALRVDLPAPATHEPVRWSRGGEAATTTGTSVVDAPARPFWRDVAAVARREVAGADGLADLAVQRSAMAATADILHALGLRSEAPAPARTTAVIGGGVWSALHMSNALRHGPVVRVASRTIGSALRRASLVGAEAATFDAAGLLDGADVAIVTGAPPMHYAHCLAAVEAGVAVLVEKPMTCTVAEARALAEAVERTGTPFVYGENWAWDPAIRTAVEHARRLDLQEVSVIGRGPRPFWGSFLTAEHGGGALFDGGAHMFELARLLLGRPVAAWVEAGIWMGTDVPVDLRGVAEVGFADGRRATVEMSWDHPTGGGTNVTGKAFSLCLNPVYRLEVEGREIPIGPSTGVGGFAEEVEALHGGPVYATVHDGLAVMELIAASYESGRTGLRVELPFAGDLDKTPLELLLGR